MMAENDCTKPTCSLNPPPCCGCVGYAYVPMQRLGEVTGADCALWAGTIFPELDLDICEYGYVCKEDRGDE